MQEDLVSESQLLTHQADHHSQTLRKILEEKETALSSLRQELVKVMEERDKLLQEPIRDQVKGQIKGHVTDKTDLEESHPQNQVLPLNPVTQQHGRENQREITPSPHPSDSELSKLQIGLKEKQVALEEKEQ
jgi:hypothetical protein